MHARSIAVRGLVVLSALACFDLLCVLPACGPDCSRDTAADDKVDLTVMSGTCSQSAGAGRVVLSGASCTIGQASSCTYVVDGAALLITVESTVCKSDGTSSDGCGNTSITCDGPALPAGTYGLKSARIVVGSTGDCTVVGRSPVARLPDASIVDGQ